MDPARGVRQDFNDKDSDASSNAQVPRQMTEIINIILKQKENIESLTDAELRNCVEQGYLRIATALEVDSYRKVGSVLGIRQATLEGERVAYQQVANYAQEMSNFNYGRAKTFFGFLSIFIGDPWANAARAYGKLCLTSTSMASERAKEIEQVAKNGCIAIEGLGSLLIGTTKLYDARSSSAK